MQNTLSRTRLIGRAGLVALLAAPSLGAQGRWENDGRDRDVSDRDWPIESRRRDDDERRLFTWRGTVDDETRIYIRAARVESEVYSGRTPRRRESIDRDRPLPRRDGTMHIQLVEGRGRVQVLQQPTARNNYTAVVRVKDAQAGADVYRFAAYFDPADQWDRNGRGPVWSEVGGDVRSGDRVLRWSGHVDGTIQMVLRPGSMDYQVLGGERPQNVSTSGVRGIPRGEGQLAVSVNSGRGTVMVVQQPTRFNNYTAIVRVLDGASGYGYYDFDLIWR
ncbi:MAG: hypothetical protein ACRENU_17700 [Gemmatimonadaceae bacterium]